MEHTYDAGMAFICEGQTEKVFYHALLTFLAKKYDFDFEQIEIKDDPDVIYVLTHDQKKWIVRFYVAGAITSMPKAGTWFQEACVKKYLKKGLWTVFLCYDTDAYTYEVTPFHEGDWKNLREKIGVVHRIVDLSAAADMEDTLLVDLEGICAFLGIPAIQREALSGRKGSVKLKTLFRAHGKAYHKAERAAPLIASLDMQKIIEKSAVALEEVEAVFKGE